MRRFFSSVIIVFLFISCSSEKPEEAARQKPSETEKAVSLPPQPVVPETKAAGTGDAKTGKVKNTPPELTRIKIMPETFKAGDTLYVDVIGSDMDGDEVTILYEWTKNGEPAGTEKHIGAPLKRGDKLSIKLTPFDGESYGQPVILFREIGNMPPMIVEDKNSLKPGFDGKTFSCRVKAIDPDNDTLTYSLKTAPARMNIEKTTGLIKWEVPQDFKGKAEIAVIVSDNHGGEALQSFVFEIKEGG